MAIRFFVEPYSGWPNELSARVAHHFEVFPAGTALCSPICTTISGIRHKLNRLSDVGGDALVRAHLMEEFVTWSAADINSWEAALYQALSESDWYCRGGFKL